MQNQNNTGFVKNLRTKPPKTSAKPLYIGKVWKRTDKRKNSV